MMQTGFAQLSWHVASRRAFHKDNRPTPAPRERALYCQRHKIENMFGRLKHWRRIHTRYDRCAHTFLSAIRIATEAVSIK